MSSRRRALAIGAIAAMLAMIAAPAWAHVTVSPGAVPASGYTKLDFSVPHGCDGSPTTAVTVQIPDGIVSVTPQVVPGWEIEMEEGPLAEPVELHGEMITEGVRYVTWRGGPLDDSHLEVFGMSVRVEGEVGETLYFPTVQTCEEGDGAWIQIPSSEGEELDHPAPALTLTEGSDGHGHGGDDATDDHGDDEATDGGAEPQATDDGETVAGGEAAGADTGSSDGAGPVAWIGLILGALGALLGGAAFAATRRSA